MEKAKFFEEKKFMWDGKAYETDAEAKDVKARYDKDRFETRIIQEEQKYYIFTRRIVTEIVLDNQ